jgi:hypothetical protein
MMRSQACSRRAVRDGFCKQHHPDTQAERDRKSKERFERERKRSPWHKLRELQKPENLADALSKWAEEVEIETEEDREQAEGIANLLTATAATLKGRVNGN